MGNQQIKRRIERLEAALEKRERERLENGLFDGTERLPAGTVVPAGSRIVKDVYYDYKFENTPAVGMTFYRGYRVERVTSDAYDFGRAVPATERQKGPEA